MNTPPADTSEGMDFRVIGQIVSASGLLHVFPSETEMGNFLVPLLTGVPGCQSTSVCFRKLAQPIGGVRGETCSLCARSLAQCSETSPYPCGLVEPGKVRAYPLETAGGFYGHLIVRIASQREYVRYEKFVQNLGNALAIILENRWQQAAMQAAKENLEQLVKKRTAELGKVIESSRDLIATMDSDHRYMVFNSAFHDEFQKVYGRDLKPGDSMTEALAHVPDAFAQSWKYWGCALAGEDFTICQEFGDAPLDRQWYELHFSPIRDSAGHVIGAVHVGREITERKRAEAEMRKSSLEIQHKNAELERFLYTASHDLKSPLVTVRNFLGYLEQDLAAGAAGKIAEDMDFILGAADKMRRLLDDVLELARAGCIVAPPVRVTFRQLVDEVLSTVAGRIAECGVTVTVGDGEVVLFGDRVRLAEVLQNLLDNSCKFMGDQPAPRIEIGFEPRAGETVFFVRDNGIGLDPRHQGKVFGLFEKLDPRAEGTGIGLAIVKRIVEVHGGRIWVESPGVGKGAAFFFTLPDAVEPTSQGEK